MTNQKTSTRPMPRILGKYKRFGKDQSREELRVTINEYNGIKYLDFRIWESGRPGQWFPTTRGVSIRERECGDLADVIIQGGKLLVTENAARRRGPVVVESTETEPSPVEPACKPIVVEPGRSVPPWEPIPA